MTTLQLLTYIVAALLLQLATGIGVMVWRRRGIEAAAPVARDAEASVASTGAWPGWREFRVARRAFEDRSQTQCSFYLEPVDGSTLAPILPDVGSGLTGQFLLDRSRRRLEEAHKRMRLQGMTPEELEDRSYWDSLTFDVVKKWRVVHFPITLAFAVLATAHIVAVFLFWGWK